MVDFISLFLRVLTVGALVGLLALLIFFKNKTVGKYVTNRSLLFSFVIALVATLGSLFYSDIAMYNPCKLCWLQRIFMYPQTLLLGAGLFKKDKKILDYSVFLTVAGTLFAAYHYGLNWFSEFNPNAVCPLSGTDNCAKAHFAWGFMNIPLMSLTAFLLLLVFYLYYKKYGSTKTEPTARGGKKTSHRS